MASARKRPAPRRLVPAELPAWAARQARQPNTWTAGLLLTLAVTVGWHHAIARGIGTESTAAAAADVSVSELIAPEQPIAALDPTVATRAVAAKPVPTHAPVDPFGPLVAADGSLQAPAAIRPAGRHVRAQTARSAPAAAASGGCAHPYVVRSGDSLWAIAAGASTTWHKVYAANHAVIGSDPGYLVAGQKLCLPGH